MRIYSDRQRRIEYQQRPFQPLDVELAARVCALCVIAFALILAAIVL